MALFAKKKQNKIVKYPGSRQLMNGHMAVISCEKVASDAAASHQSLSDSEMGALWNLMKHKFVSLW